MEQLPSEQPTPTSPTPRRKIPSFVYAIALVIGLIIISVVLSLIFKPKSDMPKSGAVDTAKLPTIALADSAKVNTRQLPSSKVLFFTMMQRTAEQQNISGDYGQGYHDDDSHLLLVHKYQFRSSHWQNNAIGFNYVDLPWDPSQTTYSGQRCIGGQFGNYANYAQPPVWKVSNDTDSKSFCDISALVADGTTNTDGMLTGGLTKSQAARWVNRLAILKNKVNNAPLFTFGNAQVTNLDGKQVIKLSATVNAITDGTYCSDFSCGQEILSLVLRQQGLDTTVLGYDDDSGANSSKAVYYLDPGTLLPVQSQVTTFSQDGSTANEYRRTFVFSNPSVADLQKKGMTVPTTRPAILDGFHNIEETGGIAPPPSN